MVESESFIKEVSEEVKRDILFKTLKKFKWTIIVLITLLSILPYFMVFYPAY